MPNPSTPQNPRIIPLFSPPGYQILMEPSESDRSRKARTVPFGRSPWLISRKVPTAGAANAPIRPFQRQTSSRSICRSCRTSPRRCWWRIGRSTPNNPRQRPQLPCRWQSGSSYSLFACGVLRTNPLLTNAASPAAPNGYYNKLPRRISKRISEQTGGAEDKAVLYPRIQQKIACSEF